MARRALITLVLTATATIVASPALAQTSPTPPGVTPAWRIVMYVLVGIVVLALLVWGFMALNRRRGAGETGVEGPPPRSDEDATPGRTPYDRGYGSQR